MERPNKGTIRVFCGPMFSGKTSSFIPIIEKTIEAKKRTKIFRPTIDDRYSDIANEKVVTNNHKIIDIDTQKVKDSAEILHQVKDLNLDLIFIDEAQFFDENLITMCHQIANMGKDIVISGLDMDAFGVPFKTMPPILSIADSIVKLKAICDYCKEEKANFTYRKDTSTEQELVGGKEKYGAICRDCESLHHKVFK